jgi:hypothetical protein
VRYDSGWEVEAPLPQYGYGLRDEVSREWVVRHLAGDVASWHAAVLSLRYDQNGERPDGHAWYRDPARYVERRLTPSRFEVALLRMWVREPDGIYGYLSLLDRDASEGGRWVPAAALRPLSPDEVAAFHADQAQRTARRSILPTRCAR